MFIDNSKPPVVGFLYSISRGGKTEYWPLHFGRNTIGRSNDNDIILSECSISSHHVVINVSRTNELKVYIQDAGSSNGTIVNSELLDYDKHECKNGDIIEIGNNQLYLIIIDSDKIGLIVSDKFVDASSGMTELVFNPIVGEFRTKIADIDSDGDYEYKKASEELSDTDEEMNLYEELGELVFNPVTGQFEYQDSGVSDDGSVITEMTCEAFCHEQDSMTKIDNLKRITQKRKDDGISYTYVIPNYLYGIKQLKEKIEEKIKRKLLPSNEYNVFTSVFAPAQVKRKSLMLVQVYFHLYEETEKVRSLALESDKNAERRDYIPLQCKLKKGEKVDVLLNIYSETLLMSEKKSVVWQGAFTKCSFDYFVPKDIGADELSCVALLTVNEIPVGEMRFVTKIVENPRQLNPEIIAHKFNKVFVSYAHKDEAKVKSFHEGLKLAGIEHFFDRAYLQIGDIFPQVIKDYINSADLFVLFWSENASMSEYVDKERKLALERAFPQVKPQQEAKLTIYPMSFEPHAELPSDMKDNYHFGEI